MKYQNYQYVRPLRGCIISENKRDVFGHPLPMGGGTHTFYGAKGSCEVDNNSYCIGIVQARLFVALLLNDLQLYTVKEK